GTRVQARAGALLCGYRDRHHPPSFPTRRSSDLARPPLRYAGRARAGRAPGAGRGADAGAWRVGYGSMKRGTRIWLTTAFAWAMSDRKSTRLNSSHVKISYAVFCLKKKKQ